MNGNKTQIEREKIGIKKGVLLSQINKKRERKSLPNDATTGLSARIAAEAWQQPRRDIAVKPYRLLVYRKTSPSELSSRLAPESSSVPAGGIGGENQRTPVFLNVLKRG